MGSTDLDCELSSAKKPCNVITTRDGLTSTVTIVCCEQSDGVPCFHCGAFHLFLFKSTLRLTSPVSNTVQTGGALTLCPVFLPPASSWLHACCQRWFIKQVEGYYGLAHMGPLLTAKWQTPTHRPHWLVLTDAEGSLPAHAPPSPWAGVWHCLSFSLALISRLLLGAWVNSTNIRVWDHWLF